MTKPRTASPKTSTPEAKQAPTQDAAQTVEVGQETLDSTPPRLLVFSVVLGRRRPYAALSELLATMNPNTNGVGTFCTPAVALTQDVAQPPRVIERSARPSHSSTQKTSGSTNAWTQV